MADIFTGLATTSVVEFSQTTTEVDEVRPPVVEDEGGCEIFLIGLFQNLPATVSIILPGPIELVCYSGTYGQGNSPLPLAPSVLKAVTPPLPIGGPYDIKVVQGDDEVTLAGALTVVARNWRTKVFGYRKLFPPWWKTGFRNLDVVDLLISELTTQVIPTLTPNVAEAFSFTPAVFNPTAVPLTWTSIGVALPGWASLNANTGEISGTPAPGDEGLLVGVQLEVTDGSAVVATNIFDIDVGVLPISVATVSSPLAATQAVPFSFIPDIDNPSGLPLTVTNIGTALPGWASLNASTGEISGTPGAPDVGTTSDIQLEITDGHSTVQTNLFDLEVT